MTTLSSTKTKTKICVVGAGPAGLATALAFHNNGFQNVSVYEKRSDISTQEVEDSYPIGCNARGKRALKCLLGVDECLGDTVASWDVYVTKYNIQVASFKSGTVASTTRSIVVNLLLKHVQEKSIPIFYNHAVTSADAAKRTVTFDIENGTKSMTCDCLIVADGYRSRARQALEKQTTTLQVRQWSWPKTFRVLVSDQNDPKNNALDPSVHYIFNSIYSAELRDGRWAVVVAAADSEEHAFLLSDQRTQENVDKLREHLRTFAPMTVNLFSDEELRNYFGRTCFQGAATFVSVLVVDDWAVLMGDAAHSPYPATGEGVNASLEDAYVLNQVLQESDDNTSIKDILSKYQDQRLADTHALSDIAYSTVRPSRKDALQKVALKLSCGRLSDSKVLGADSVQELLFGPSTATRILSYSEIVDEWEKQLRRIGGRPRVPPSSASTHE